MPAVQLISDDDREVARGQHCLFVLNRLEKGKKLTLYGAPPRYGHIRIKENRILYTAKRAQINSDDMLGIRNNISESFMVMVEGTSDYYYLRARIEDRVQQTEEEQAAVLHEFEYGSASTTPTEVNCDKYIEALRLYKYQVNFALSTMARKHEEIGEIIEALRNLKADGLPGND
jgi:hypothetical protein